MLKTSFDKLLYHKMERIKWEVVSITDLDKDRRVLVSRK